MRRHQPEPGQRLHHIELRDGAAQTGIFAELRQLVVRSELRARRRLATFEPPARVAARSLLHGDPHAYGVRIVTGPWLDGLSVGPDHRPLDPVDVARPLIVFGALLHTEADASAREQVWSSLRQALRVTVIDQDSLHVLDFLGVEGSIVTDPLILVSQHCQPDVLARRHRFLSLAGFVPTGPEPIVVDLRTIGPSEASSWLEGCPGPARRRLVVIDDALGQGAASGHASGSQRRSVEGVTYAPALLGIDDVLAIIGGASLVVTDDRDLAVVAEAFDVETRATAPCKAGISGPPIDLVDVRRRHGPAMEAAASARLERQRQAGSDIDALVLDLDVGWALAAPASGAAVRSIDDLEYELEALRAQAAESTRREATMRVALADRFLELVRDLELARTELAGAMTDVAKLESMLHLQSVAARREIRARLASTDRDSR